MASTKQVALWPFWMTENSINYFAISDQYATFIFLIFVLQNYPRRPFWMTENHFWAHFSPFQINAQLCFLNFVHKIATGGHFGWPKITFDRISHHFRSIHNFPFFFFFFKMAVGGHFGSSICAKNNRILPLCAINGYAKYAVDRWIYDTVRDATSFLSIFIQNDHQRPFCFSEWSQKS